ncbi:MAG TPA: rhomboid family intramembrane serine protease [Candidatus Obscuribacterales bacterium]
MPLPSRSAGSSQLTTPAWTLGGLVGLLWGVQILNVGLLGGRLIFQGIYPRQMDGLQGILWAPLLHGSFQHLMANTIPLLTLGGLILLGQAKDFWVVTVMAALVSGLGTWLIGAPGSVHIGASGIVFGYFGYLLLRSYFERSAFAITASILVIVFYGGFWWGVLPTQPGVSWEGHLFGFVGGSLAAWALSRRPA